MRPASQSAKVSVDDCTIGKGMPVVPAGRAMAARPVETAASVTSMPHPRCSLARNWLSLLLWAATATVGPPSQGAELSGFASRAATSARQPPRRPAQPAVMFDPAVVPAGGAGCCSARDGSGRVSQAGFHHAHAPGCRDGMCVPSCPVRPGHFGYYGTQWRRWPGQGVIQTSAAEAATPVAPPKSAVPGADEESPQPREAAEALEPPAAPEDEPARPLPRESGASDIGGPWSRMVAAASLPPGYEPPHLTDDESQTGGHPAE